MKLRNFRRLIVLLILTISVILLMWSVWPVAETTLVLPISPQEMQIPTPGSYLPVLGNVIAA